METSQSYWRNCQVGWSAERLINISHCHHWGNNIPKRKWQISQGQSDGRRTAFCFGFSLRLENASKAEGQIFFTEEILVTLVWPDMLVLSRNIKNYLHSQTHNALGWNPRYFPPGKDIEICELSVCIRLLSRAGIRLHSSLNLADAIFHLEQCAISYRK